MRDLWTMAHLNGINWLHTRTKKKTEQSGKISIPPLRRHTPLLWRAIISCMTVFIAAPHGSKNILEHMHPEKPQPRPVATPRCLFVLICFYICEFTWKIYLARFVYLSLSLMALSTAFPPGRINNWLSEPIERLPTGRVNCLCVCVSSVCVFIQLDSSLAANGLWLGGS